MFVRIRSSLLIFFIVLSANLLYSQGGEYRALPLPTVADVNRALSGLNLPGYGSAACAAAYPASMPVPCMPIDPQTLAYAFAAGDPTKLVMLKHGNSTFSQGAAGSKRLAHPRLAE